MPRQLQTIDALFVWIPRTGGTTISRWLSKAIGMRTYTQQPAKRSKLYHTFENFGAATFGHTSPNSLLHAGFITRAYFDKAWKFSIVRHPEDRFMSHVLRLHVKLCKYGIHVPIRKIVDDCCECLKTENVPPIGLWNSAYKGVPYVSSGLNPQSRWLCRGQRVAFVDKIYKFGDFRSISNDIAARLNVPPPQAVQHRNATRDKRGYLTTRHKSIIETYYAADYSIFGFKHGT